MSTVREIVRFLKSTGFIEKRQRGSHLVLQLPATKYRAVIPVHSGDLPKGLLHRILKDAGLTLEEFLHS